MEPNKETQRAWLTLSRTPGVGAVRLRALVERHEGDVLAALESAPASQAVDPDYVRLLEVMGYDPLPLELLVERTGLSAAALSSMLLMLELDNQVASVAGGRYQRLPTVTAGADNA